MCTYKERPPLPGAASRRDSMHPPLFVRTRESHHGMLPDDQLSAILAARQQCDRRMVEHLHDALLPAMLAADNFHARRDLGIPVRLCSPGAEKNVQVLMLVGVEQAVTTCKADYAWYTPAQPDKDYCAGMEKAH